MQPVVRHFEVFKFVGGCYQKVFILEEDSDNSKELTAQGTNFSDITAGRVSHYTGASKSSRVEILVKGPICQLGSKYQKLEILIWLGGV